MLLIVACVMSFTVGPMAVAADITTQAAHREGDAGANSHDLVQGSHVEGHIAFLKAELAITPAQESLWMPVATAMREDVRNLQEADAKAIRTPGPNNAIEYLESRVTFANLRAQGEARFLTAMRPLYENLSAQQKHVADGLLIPETDRNE
jgi:LTXXQ motif family protein